MPEKQMTELINLATKGDQNAANMTAQFTNDELKKYAAWINKSKSPTMSPTALLHEAWISVFSQATSNGLQFENRFEFIAYMRVAISHRLTDYWRRKNRKKRGGGVPHVPLDDVIEHISAKSGLDFTSVNVFDCVERVISELEQSDVELAKVAQLVLFSDLTKAQMAASIGMSKSTLDRRWNFVRSKLGAELVESGLGGEYDQ